MTTRQPHSHLRGQTDHKSSARNTQPSGGGGGRKAASLRRPQKPTLTAPLVLQARANVVATHNLLH